LWDRGAAVFRQEWIDLFIPTYKGSVAANSPFDPAGLSAIVLQIKFKTDENAEAGNALRPVGIPRDPLHPLPYLAVLLELGSNSNYQDTGTKIKTTTPRIKDGDEFSDLRKEWWAAMGQLEEYCHEIASEAGGAREDAKAKDERKKREQARVKQLRAKVETKKQIMDSFNRFSIFVRGASPGTYGVLKTAKIEREFAKLLSVTSPSSMFQVAAIQHMRPLERLGNNPYNAWMSEYD
jgi:hypothetical protein